MAAEAVAGLAQVRIYLWRDRKTGFTLRNTTSPIRRISASAITGDAMKGEFKGMRAFSMLLPVVAALTLGACSGGGSGSNSSIGGGNAGATVTAESFAAGNGGGGVTYSVCTPATAQKDALIAFFDAHEGDTIQFCAGTFNLTTGLTLTGKRGITIKGAGRDQTILSFKGSDAQDGINISRVDGIVVQGLTIYDAPGNGLRIFRSNFVTVRDVKVGWTDADDQCPTRPACPLYDSSMASWVTNGSYAFYPVLSHHIFIENSVSVGSSDAGVYVGQSNDILVQHTEAYHNVAGFEFENTFRAEFIHNVSHDNVGGFLVFDLPGRAQFGEKNVVHYNESYNNNIPSFAPRGAIVGDVPSGTGMLVLASDQLEVDDNNIHNNNFSGLAIVNYGLVDNNEPSTNYDFFPEGIHVYNNTFTDNGGSPPLPDLSRSSCHGLLNGLPVQLPVTLPAPLGGILAGLPGISDLNNPTCITNNASLLPTILVAKNLGKSAQIIWDGARDVPNSCADYPKDHYGVPLNQPDAQDVDRYEARVDERGRPNLYIYDPMPTCKYNKWKFNAQGALNLPANGMCIQGNTFSATQLQTLLVDPYVNLHFATADPTLPSNLALVDHNQPQDCPTLSPTLVATELAPRLGSFTPNPANDPHPSDAQLGAVCGAGQPGQVNSAALARYNCPLLSQYGLFKNPSDPTQAANGTGVPYDLNTILFSDYAEKFRFLFLPLDANGAVQKATYEDHTNCQTLTIYNCYTATLGFPTGTVFVKTFGFTNGTTYKPVETRLLIKRVDASGNISWVGLPYEWQTDASGHLTDAVLKLEGDSLPETYDYDDPDPAVVDANGKRVHYKGTVAAYGIPNASACLQCHGGDDREPGAAPIGPKVRYMNKDHTYEDGSTLNQLTYLQQKGLLDLPDDPSKLEKMAKWNVPGSGGDSANSPADVHHRVRAFLEVNCMHCHNPAGGAQNSGLSLDSFNEPMDEGHGICKPPIAAGRAADVGNYDIQPGNASQSVLPYRVTSVQPGIRMPPLARTVQDAEFVTLADDWVNNVVNGFASASSNTCSQTSTALPISMMKSLLPAGSP
ncbi:MAG: parallel beta-helix domain-containing protein [Stenotrophobium sp.]